MTKVIDHQPFTDFLQDIFESEELAINIVIVNMGHSYDKPQIKHIPSRPPAQRGVVRPIRITPVPLVQPKKGKR